MAPQECEKLKGGRGGRTPFPVSALPSRPPRTALPYTAWKAAPCPRASTHPRLHDPAVGRLPLPEMQLPPCPKRPSPHIQSPTVSLLLRHQRLPHSSHTLETRYTSQRFTPEVWEQQFPLPTAGLKGESPFPSHLGFQPAPPKKTCLTVPSAPPPPSASKPPLSSHPSKETLHNCPPFQRDTANTPCP